MHLDGICRSRDNAGSPDGWYLQMRLYPSNLRQWLTSSGKLPADERMAQATAILKGMVKGLGFLHQMGIIHCDLKPENVLLTNDQPPVPVLADFETAKVQRANSVTTQILGTGQYVAPEVVRQGNSAASDMYAVGVILSEMLTGKPLSFQDKFDRNSQQQLVLQQLLHHDPAQRPSAATLLQSPFLRSLRDCCVCGDSFPLFEGIECRGDGCHFLCSDCFNQHVLHQAGQDLRMIKKRDGRLMCALWAPKEPRPPTHCESPPFLDDEVARCASADAFKEYVNCRTKLAEERLAEHMQAEHDERMKAELRRLQQMDERSRKVEAAVHQLRDVLCDHCPRCGQVFVDFTGCFALTCGKCSCAFCAWCLADCGADAHGHVVRCQHNLNPRKDVFSTRALFEEGRRLRQMRTAEQFLQRLEPVIAKEVTAHCRQDLHDAGLGRLVACFGGEAGQEYDLEYALSLHLQDE
jgi:hypothetical protein